MKGFISTLSISSEPWIYLYSGFACERSTRYHRHRQDVGRGGQRAERGMLQVLCKGRGSRRGWSHLEVCLVSRAVGGSGENGPLHRNGIPTQRVVVRIKNHSQTASLCHLWNSASAQRYLVSWFLSSWDKNHLQTSSQCFHIPKRKAFSLLVLKVYQGIYEYTQRCNCDSFPNNYLDTLLSWSAHFPQKDRSKNK